MPAVRASGRRLAAASMPRPSDVARIDAVCMSKDSAVVKGPPCSGERTIRWRNIAFLGPRTTKTCDCAFATREVA
jgi:hypothetical protein